MKKMHQRKQVDEEYEADDDSQMAANASSAAGKDISSILPPAQMPVCIILS